jgi:hypothetical protein
MQACTMTGRMMALAICLAALGCGDKKKADDPKAKNGATAPASKGQQAPSKTPAKPALEAPKTVLVYGGLNNANQAADALTKLAQQVMPEVPPLSAMMGPVLQQQFKLKSADVLDLSKPVRFAIFDHKQFGRAPEALLVGIKAPKAFADALPATGKKENADGNAWTYLKYEGSRQPVFVNFAGNFAVITRNKDIFPKHKDFFTALSTATLPETGAIMVEMEHVMASRGDLFKRNLADLRKTMAQAGDAAKMGGQMDAAKKMIDWVEKAALEVDTGALYLVTRPDGLKFDFRLNPKDGSNLSKSFMAFKGQGRAALLGKMPANSPAFATFDFDPKQALNAFNVMSKAFAIDPIFGGDTAKAKPYLDAMNQYVRGMDGQMVMGVMPSASGMEIVSLFGVSDAKAVRTAQATMSGMYTDPAAQAYYDKMGIKMQLQQKAYTVGGVPVDIVRTTMTNLPPEAAGMIGMMGDFFVQHIAIGDTLGVMAYGESGKTRVEAMLNGKVPGGLDNSASIKRAIKEAAPNFSMLAWVNPIELAKGVKLGGMNPLAAMLGDIKSTSGLGISAGINGSAAQMVIDIPVALVKDGFAAFQKTKGGF